MTIAGTKTINNATFKVKEVYLDKALKPADEANYAFIITFYFDAADTTLKKITFTPTSSNRLKAFTMEEDIIKRYSGLKRPDENFMNILRKRSIENLVSLKKYVFECQKFIN